MKFKPATLLLALIAVAAAPAFAQNVATVNGKVIPSAQMDAAVKQAAAQGQPDSPQLREMIKKSLIGREVLVQEATKQGVAANKDVKDALEQARQEIIIRALLVSYVKKNPVSDAEIKSAYDQFKASKGEKEYHARHILVKTEKEATDIIAKLKGGAKFEELAKASQDPGSAANGGDLDWAAPGNYVKPFADAMVALKDGQVTDKPVQSQFGYHVIKLEGSRAAKVPSLDEIKGQISESLTQRKVAAYRDQLIAKAKVQ
ncbi:MULTISPECIES: peptidylprolyl isomerase [unclassified Duganella]|uniref:peptidylprolyl isomerase n=1 Tax=unclassified Duganella TaxID=2636909 RepID=UPI0006F4C52F|nr:MULTISPECIES: peptidylprolyl isomerase [unclassified Duganella]KQV56438.1 peptidylprolyl isomerase [Duganella sp. Root336D2]KRB96506.1 peptidylprolyl isomerase [Duganella sp. Root198D2]